MNKLVIICAVFIFFLLVVIPVGLTFAIRMIPGGVQPSLGNTKSVYGDFTLSQSFISPQDNLAGIGVSIKNPNFANKKNAYIKIYDSSNNVIRTVTINGQNIADGKFVKILFDPIYNSKDKKFTWSISSPESTFDNALQIFLTDNQPSWSVSFNVNGKFESDGLSYVTLHRPVTSTEVLGRVVRSWLYKFTQDKPFLVSYLVLIIALVIGIIFSKSGFHYLKKQA